MPILHCHLRLRSGIVWAGVALAAGTKSTDRDDKGLFCGHRGDLTDRESLRYPKDKAH